MYSLGARYVTRHIKELLAAFSHATTVYVPSAMELESKLQTNQRVRKLKRCEIKLIN